MSNPIGMGVVGAGAIGIRGALKHLNLADGNLDDEDL